MVVVARLREGTEVGSGVVAPVGRREAGGGGGGRIEVLVVHGNAGLGWGDGERGEGRGSAGLQARRRNGRERRTGSRVAVCCLLIFFAA